MQLTFDNIQGSGELYLKVMKSILGDTQGKSMADLGCNQAPYTCQLGFEKRVYIDILPRTLDDANEQQYFIQADVLEFLNDNKVNQFDVTIASDFCEHLTPMGGTKLLNLMELSSKKQVLFTPLGSYLVNDDDDPEGHHSGWTPEIVSDYASIIFPNWHPQLNIGAFFFWKCDDLENDFKRVCNELKNLLN